VTTTAVAGSVRRPAPPGLRASLRQFTTYPSARWLAGMVAGSLAARVALGGFAPRDAVIVAAFVAAQPFTEWLIHVYVLHRTVPERPESRLDFGIARSHQRHHRQPRDPRFTFIALPALKVFAALDVVLLVLAWRYSAGIATGLVVANALTLAYEWTHWLIHSDYQPRGRFYRGLWRAHRLHHFRNENYWYGVTGHLGDRLLRTYPAKDDVPLSPTATTLGSPL
jgi:sterol desaturase/sphingolipid hydroxylase (fatty acid hydroxylase superfamily)